MIQCKTCENCECCFNMLKLEIESLKAKNEQLTNIVDKNARVLNTNCNTLREHIKNIYDILSK